MVSISATHRRRRVPNSLVFFFSISNELLIARFSLCAPNELNYTLIDICPKVVQTPLHKTMCACDDNERNLNMNASENGFTF